MGVKNSTRKYTISRLLWVLKLVPATITASPHRCRYLRIVLNNFTNCKYYNLANSCNNKSCISVIRREIKNRVMGVHINVASSLLLVMVAVLSSLQ